MSREHALGAVGSYVALVTRAVRLIAFAMVPVAAIGITLRAPIVELLFGYGRFDAAAVSGTAATLALFLIGLPAHASIAVLARAFYARQDTRTPVGAAVLAVLVNTVLGVLLVGRLGLPGLALAIAFAAWIEAGVLVVALGSRVPTFDRSAIVRVLAESAIGAVVAVIVATVAAGALGALLAPGSSKATLLIATTLVTLAGGTAYVGVALALRIPELPVIAGLLADQVRRRRGS